MNFNVLLNSLGSIGFFSTRIFLPALLTALLIRFGADIPWIQHTPLLHLIVKGHHPAWFTSNASIAVLAALSILEALAQKNPEARRLLHEFDSYLKSGMALLTTLGVASATDSKFVLETAHQAGFTAYIPALLAAAGSFSVARVRGAALAVLHDMDHDDSLHLQRLISWAEEAWIAFGMLFLVLYPIVMIVVIAIVIGLLIAVRKYLEHLEEKSKAPCAHCGTPIYPSAMACFHCKQAVAQPHEIGILGQSKTYPAADPVNHPFRLIEKKRCPVCASRLKQSHPHQACEVCGHELMEPRSERDAYLNYVGGRLPIVLGICALWSFVPILGMVVGTIYFRIRLVNPFSIYLPLGKRFLLRWGIRLLFLVLVFFQLVPVAGALAVPIVAIVSYWVYRSSFEAAAIEQAGFPVTQSA